MKKLLKYLLRPIVKQILKEEYNQLSINMSINPQSLNQEQTDKIAKIFAAALQQGRINMN